LSDQDDVWKYNKIETFQKYLHGYDVVMSNISIIDNKDKVVKKCYFSTSPIPSNIIYAILTNPYFGCAMAFRRNMLKYILPIPKSCVSYDLWIGCLAQKYATVGFIDEPLTNYRRHDRNISFATGKSHNGLWFKIYWRLQFLLHLSFRVMILSYANKCLYFFKSLMKFNYEQ
jgi:hypothetical protein